MVTLTIDVPEVERRIRELAAARQMNAEDYLVELVTAQISTLKEPAGRELSVQERKAILRRFAERIPTDAPLLSDEALSRENLYDERGL